MPEARGNLPESWHWDKDISSPLVEMRWELWRVASELTHFSLQADDRLSEKETEDLMAWMRNALGSRVTNVKVRPPWLQ